MSQISMPVRALLAVCLILMAAWFTVLKPKDEVIPPAPTAPAPGAATDATPGNAASQPGQAVENAAKTAESAANASTEREGTAQTSPSTGTATGTGARKATGAAAAPPLTAKQTKDLPASIVRAIEDKKVLVLFFQTRKADDDRFTRHELKDVYRHQGRVSVHRVRIEKISSYSPITRGADVSQAPALVVVDGSRRAQTLEGFTDTAAIDQAVVDALLATGNPAKTVPYLRRLETMCARTSNQATNIRQASTSAELKHAASRIQRLYGRLGRRVAASTAPRRYRRVKAAILRLTREATRFGTALKGGAVTAAASASERKLAAISADVDLLLAGYGVERCR